MLLNIALNFDLNPPLEFVMTMSFIFKLLSLFIVLGEYKYD